MSLTDTEQTEPVWEGGSGYTIVAWANGEKVILYHEFGSYQGEWLMLTKGAADYRVYKDYYGSCSGCDSYQATFDSWNDKPTLSRAKEFAKDYKSFIEVPFETMRNLATAGTLSKIFPANVEDRYSEVSYDDFAADAQVAVKLEEGLDVTAADLLACKNQEIKAAALKRFGYENFLRDAEMEVIDDDGVNQLLKKGDIVFAHVKDSSTPRRYLLRVPPQMKNLREAIAWTFNMTAEEYAPLIET